MADSMAKLPKEHTITIEQYRELERQGVRRPGMPPEFRRMSAESEMRATMSRMGYWDEGTLQVQDRTQE